MAFANIASKVAKASQRILTGGFPRASKQIIENASGSVVKVGGATITAATGIISSPIFTTGGAIAASGVLAAYGIKSVGSAGRAFGEDIGIFEPKPNTAPNQAANYPIANERSNVLGAIPSGQQNPPLRTSSTLSTFGWIAVLGAGALATYLLVRRQ